MKYNLRKNRKNKMIDLSERSIESKYAIAQVGYEGIDRGRVRGRWRQ